MLECVEDRTVPAGTISVAAGANAYEGGSAGGFVLSRTDTTAAQSVNFSFGGTASSSDYAQPLMAYFDVGQASITLTIPAADDSISEPTETITLILGSGSDYTVGAAGSATIDLIDNDPAAPLVGIAAFGDVAAGTLRITRADPTGPLTVNYLALTKVGGMNYTYPSSVSFAAGHVAPIGGEQTDWLDSALAEREGRPHLFVANHVPAYPSYRAPEGGLLSGKFGTGEGNRLHWCPLFEKYNVDAVLEHHDHTFKRTNPLKGGLKDKYGVPYLGDGSWGML